jgi:N-acetylneuraminic acid mutarotase
MPEAREQFTLTALGGEAYVIGGFGEDGRTAPQSGVWIYTHSVSSWREGPAMPIALARHAAVGFDGLVYVFGGVEESGAASDRIFTLAGSGAGWRELSVRMPEPLADMAIAAVDGKIYVLGGRRESGEVTSRVDVFDPATQSWSRATAMPGARAEHTADVVEGKIHVAGGIAGNVFQTYADHFTYDPSTDRWHTAEALRSPRHSLASAVVGNKWYVVGGGAGAGLFTEFTEADSLEVYDPSGSE